MDVSNIYSQASKLIEAYEKSSAPSGSELKSNGPQAVPNDELVKEFETQMNVTQDKSHHDQSLEHENVANINNIPQNQATDVTSKSHDIHGVDNNKVNAMDLNNVDYVLQELQTTMQTLKSGNFSAAELYRVQFLTGMLNVHVQGEVKLSQSSAQNIDMLLKQQG